ncbi:MAG: DUF2500 domain-containing protein [Turicibacter sp.]|nr:DUF2500 domain-containing protein [Turicibacter sp.]
MGFGSSGVIFEMFPILFFMVFAFIIFPAIRNVWEWSRNNNSPIATSAAKVIGKRTKVDSHPHQVGEIHQHHTSTTYFATFELQNGNRLEFKVKGHDYGLLAEHDQGILTYQGSRFIAFEGQR